MSTQQPNTSDRRESIAAAAGSAGSPDVAMVTAERAFVSDVRLVLAVLNWARYPLLNRLFGVSREQVNILTFVLAVSAADATYEVLRRIIRNPWPLDGPDTVIGTLAVREAGFSLAGPKVRETQLFGTLIALAAIGSLVLPRTRRALHRLHVIEQRVGQQRMRIYGAAERARGGASERLSPPAPSAGRIA